MTVDGKCWNGASSFRKTAVTSVDRLLDQNIKGERCAICVYQKILDYVRGKDMITGHIIRHILQEEVEHEQDLEDIQRDIADFRKK